MTVNVKESDGGIKNDKKILLNVDISVKIQLIKQMCI